METNIVTCRCRCGARWDVDLAPIDDHGSEFVCVTCHNTIKVARDRFTGRYMFWEWYEPAVELTALPQLC